MVPYSKDSSIWRAYTGSRHSGNLPYFMQHEEPWSTGRPVAMSGIDSAGMERAIPRSNVICIGYILEG